MATGSINLCGLCGVICSLNCEQCNNAYYCSQEHLLRDRPNHESRCFPVKIMEDPIWGKYLVATKTIKVGDIILKEKPLFSAPCDDFETGENIDRVVCIVCYIQIENPNSRCTKCKWPVCSILCENDEVHSGNECLLLSQSGVQDSFHLYYMCIAIIRGLKLKHTVRQNWHNLKALNIPNSSDTLFNHLWALRYQEVFSNIQNVVRIPNLEKLKLVFRVVLRNAIWSNDRSLLTTTTPLRHGIFMYYRGSMVLPRCIETNTIRVIRDDGEVYLRAIMPICQGEVLSASFTPPLMGTHDRRLLLIQRHNFHCFCRRCTDPSENGIHFSTLKCVTRKCMTNGQSAGLIMCIDPTNMESNWRCNNPQCGIIYSHAFVQLMILRARSAIHAVSNIKEPYSVIAEKVEILITRLKRRLHQNHYLITDAQFGLLFHRHSALISEDPNHNEPIKYIDIARAQIYQVCNTMLAIIALLPGYSRNRGSLQNRVLAFLKERAQSFLIYLNIVMAQKNSEMFLRTHEEMLQRMKPRYLEVLEIRKFVYETLQYEPKCRGESEMAVIMINKEEIMGKIIETFFQTIPRAESPQVPALQSKRNSSK